MKSCTNCKGEEKIFYSCLTKKQNALGFPIDNLFKRAIIKKIKKPMRRTGQDFLCTNAFREFPAGVRKQHDEEAIPCKQSG